MDELLGKTVAGLRVSSDQSVLTFDLSDGASISYEAEADFCSETWFADITGVPALRGGTVLEVEPVEIAAVDDGRTRQEHDEFYGVKLRTDKGYVDIVYRNSSNGYYGGYITLKADGLPDGMVAITDDWRA